MPMEAWPSWAAGRMANLLLRFKQGIFGNDPLANYQESQQPPATHPFPTFSTSKFLGCRVLIRVLLVEVMLKPSETKDWPPKNPQALP